MLNEKTFLEGMSLIAELFDKKPSDNMMNLYYTVLQELTDEQFKQAINAIARTNKYNCMPKPAEILEQVHGTAQDETLNAWAYAVGAIGKVGAYRSPIFEDGAISETIQHLGGWVVFCDTPQEELKWVQKEFEKFYPVFKKHSRGNVRLSGIAEQHNALKNLENFNEDKIYIGNIASNLKSIEIHADSQKMRGSVSEEGEEWKK